MLGFIRTAVVVSTKKDIYINLASELLQKASLGKYEESHAMFDAGSITWEGNLNGETIKLKEWGDFKGTNSAPEAEQLVRLIDRWCK